jgi:DNA-binding HxlR family transcriptional regulator
MDRGYGQYCPVAKGAEVFAERWTPLILRNLYLGCRGFGEIHRGVPRMSRSLLSQRLAALERDGIVQRRPDLVVLTDSRTLTQVHMGRLQLGQAIHAGTWEAQGPPELARELMTWGGVSPFADVVPASDD